MQDNINSDGLCSTCKFSDDCMFAKNQIESVYYCEEYQTADATHKVRKAIIFPGTGRAPRHNPNSLTNKSPHHAMGLCSNCIHRKVCSFLKPAGGVWHCEEYA